MRIQKAIINYSYVRDNDLTEVSQLIINKLTGNTYFLNPPVTLIIVQTATDDYSTALVQAKDGTKADTADKNAKRLILEGYLSQLADYVNDTAKGDLVMLESSGCPLSKPPEPIGILPAPESFKVSEGDDPGEAKIEFDVVDRASGYLVLYRVVEGIEVPPDAEWQRKHLSKATGMITGLPSGAKCEFKAAATSPEADEIEQYNFTEPIEKYIQ
jgi:hypothetical protein